MVWCTLRTEESLSLNPDGCHMVVMLWMKKCHFCILTRCADRDKWQTNSVQDQKLQTNQCLRWCKRSYPSNDPQYPKQHAVQEQCMLWPVLHMGYDIMNGKKGGFHWVKLTMCRDSKLSGNLNWKLSEHVQETRMVSCRWNCPFLDTQMSSVFHFQV